MAAKNGGKFCAFAFFLYLCSHSHGEKQMMKIVILDGYGANPGDLSWDGLSEVGQVTVYDRTEPADVVSRAADADAVLTTCVPLLQYIRRTRYEDRNAECIRK